MTALLYLIHIYIVVDRFKGSGFGVQGSGFGVQGSGFRVRGCGGGFAANSNGALRAGPLSLLRRRWWTASAVDRVLPSNAHL